jgi:hypothetical protein
MAGRTAISRLLRDPHETPANRSNRNRRRECRNDKKIADPALTNEEGHEH